MSFVAGFVTGMSAGEAFERRNERNQFRAYMEQHGFAVIDKNGRQIPLNTVVDEALVSKKKPGRTILVAGAILVGIVLITGGSAWAAVALVS